MTVSLVDVSGAAYNPREGRFRTADGVLLGAADMRLIVNGERIRLEANLLKITERYLEGELTTAKWQELILEALKESNIRALVVAAGGLIAIQATRHNREYFKALREGLEGLASAFALFTVAVLTGQKTKGQIRGWMKYQSASVFRTYNRANSIAKMGLLNHNEAMRFLDPTANHCPDCPAYDTHGQWIAIEDVVPVGSACRCSGRCRCTVVTRFNPERLLNTGGVSLQERIEHQRDNLSNLIANIFANGA